MHDTLLGVLRLVIDKAEEAKQAAEDGDPEESVAILQEADEVGEESDAAAKEYGFEECGSEGER